MPGSVLLRWSSSVAALRNDRLRVHVRCPPRAWRSDVRLAHTLRRVNRPFTPQPHRTSRLMARLASRPLGSRSRHADCLLPDNHGQGLARHRRPKAAKRAKQDGTEWANRETQGDGHEEAQRTQGSIGACWPAVLLLLASALLCVPSGLPLSCFQPLRTLRGRGGGIGPCSARARGLPGRIPLLDEWPAVTMIEV